MSKLSPAQNTARYPRRKGLMGAVGAVALFGAVGCGEAVGPGDSGGGSLLHVDAGRPDAGPLALDSGGVLPMPDAATPPEPLDASAGIWVPDAE